MIKVGITGQAGFVGTHLFNTLSFREGFERVPFEDGFFQNESSLDQFVSQCDVVVHLAAMNRHNDPEVLYQTNIGLVKKLISAFDRTNSRPHVLFSSSTQEERDNLYGKSKKEGRELFEGWAKEKGGKFTGIIIPNVYGPFGHPYYNSVVATFCHQLTHGETPEVNGDGEIKLVFVTELVDDILDKVLEATKKDKGLVEKFLVPHRYTITVLQLLALITKYKEEYFEQGKIPLIENRFELNLFNTFRCYMPIKDHFPVKYVKYTDPRGAFVELARLDIGGQTSYSTTVPDITRGNHFHTRKIERFSVIKGKALIEMRRIGTEEVFSFELDGEEPSYVDMPIWHTHNVKNVGDEELITVFWINEPYDEKDSDTYFETV
jgi:UDP-2-acetamido-2,6-beta-L-arabino-hexul-4-ose reductase